MKKSTRLLLITFLMLALFVLLPCWLTWRAVRQERLNDELLHICWMNDTQSVKSLLDQGTDPNARSSHDSTRLSIAEWIRWRLGKWPKGAVGYFPTPLMGASMNGADSVVNLLLGRGADINARSEISGQTALTAAAAANHKDTVKLLLDRGADVHAKEKDGKTALQYAIQGKHADIIRLLQQADAKE
jgi:ankyrin repeat protein